MFQLGSQVSVGGGGGGSTIFGPFQSQVPAMPKPAVTQQSQMPAGVNSPASALQRSTASNIGFQSQIPAPPRLDVPSTIHVSPQTSTYLPQSQLLAPMAYSQVLPSVPSNLNIQSRQPSVIPQGPPSVTPSQVRFAEPTQISRVKMTQSNLGGESEYTIPQPQPLPPVMPVGTSSYQTLVYTGGSDFKDRQDDNLIRELARESADVNDENFQEIRIEKMDFGMRTS